MTNQQIQWAMRHDWFLSNGINAQGVGFVRVKTDSYDWTEEFVDFTDYQGLREWAGY